MSLGKCKLMRHYYTTIRMTGSRTETVSNAGESINHRNISVHTEHQLGNFLQKETCVHHIWKAVLTEWENLDSLRMQACGHTCEGVSQLRLVSEKASEGVSSCGKTYF